MDVGEARTVISEEFYFSKTDCRLGKFKTSIETLTVCWPLGKEIYKHPDLHVIHILDLLYRYLGRLYVAVTSLF